MDNHTIAERLMNYANSLEATEGNLFRVQAYRRAAQTVLEYQRPIANLLAERGRDGLEELPGIGAHLSYTIEGLVQKGEFRTFTGVDERIDSERVFGSLPGIGRRLARQIREELQIETLEELEQAAHAGRLQPLHVGPKRLRGIIDALAGRLRRLPERAGVEPSVAELLVVDRAYRTLAEEGQLPRLAPRRFNPNHQTWLPVYQVVRAGWYYKALFSNTAVAHRLGQTGNWVVIYFQRGEDSGQRTVVTEARGTLRGRRVVRGREAECNVHYAGRDEPAAAPI